MGHHLLQSNLLHPSHQFLGPEGPFPRSAPYVDAAGVENQDPDVSAFQLPSKCVERHLVVRRDQNGRVPVGSARGIEPRRDPVPAPSDPPPHPPSTCHVASGDRHSNPGNRPDRRIRPSFHKPIRAGRFRPRRSGTSAAGERVPVRCPPALRNGAGSAGGPLHRRCSPEPFPNKRFHRMRSPRRLSRQNILL